MAWPPLSYELGFIMRRSSKALASLLILNVVVGAVEGRISSRPGTVSPLFLISWLGFAICIFAWCKADAAERGVRAGSAPLFCGMFALIGVPYYLFRSRPPRQAIAGTIKAVVFFVVQTLAYMAALQASADLTVGSS